MDLVPEGIETEGFGEGCIGTQFIRDVEEVVGVHRSAAGHGNDFEGGKGFSDFLDGFQTFLFGHDEVCDEEVWKGGLKLLESVAAVFRFGDGAAVAFEASADDFSDFFVVVDDENFGGPALHAKIIGR